MSDSHSSSVEEIVRRAEQLPPAERSDFLGKSFDLHSAEYAQAAELLRSRSPHGWWDNSAGPPPENEGEEARIERSRIGPYRIVSVIGEGGMGEVLLAERADNQFSQRVAIKLVRRGTTSRQVQNRLKLERQILATLDHPNIAKLLDGGTSEDGLPYIVMEYIDGIPIDQYCDARRLTVEERIRLMQVVCSAVHYAHQNLIVHRDLKPSNILISADGVPKLLDFGIAKVLDDRAFAHTLAVTHLDYRLMTPDHASPEQVRGDPITTASDIYVLGVLLYELLTGHKPFSCPGNRLGELEHAICELPPLPLDSQFRQHQGRQQRERIRETCELRSTTAAKLKRHLAGDLGRIVMMALRKEPERRYPSVQHLAADLDRYLQNLPVAARPDSVGYRTRKFLRRHAFGALVSAAAVLGLIVFSVVTTIQAQRIERERLKADQVASFLTALFERSDPSQSRGKDITVREILDAGAARIDREFVDQPETGASLLTTIGNVYTNLGEYEEAIPRLERSLRLRRMLHGDHHADVAVSRQALGEALMEKRDLTAAETQLDEALRIMLDIHGEQSIQVAAILHKLGRLRQMQERFDESRALFERSLRFLDAHANEHFEELTSTLGDYAILLNYISDVASAEAIFRRVLRLDQEHYGADHPETTTAMHNLAVALEQQGKLAEARPYFTEALETHRRVFGAESPQYMAALSSYGRYLRRAGDATEAERVLREAVTLRREKFGADHYLVAYTNVSLAMALLDLDRPAAAERELQSALAIYDRTLPRAHLYVATALRNLGLALLDQQRLADAERQLREAVAIQTQLVGADNPQVVQTEAVLGAVLLARREYEQAETLLLRSYPVVLASQGATDPITVRVRGWIETLFAQTGRPDEAVSYFARLGTDSPLSAADR